MGVRDVSYPTRTSYCLHFLWSTHLYFGCYTNLCTWRHEINVLYKPIALLEGVTHTNFHKTVGFRDQHLILVFVNISALISLKTSSSKPQIDKPTCINSFDYSRKEQNIHFISGRIFTKYIVKIQYMCYNIPYTPFNLIQ